MKSKVPWWMADWVAFVFVMLAVAATLAAGYLALGPAP
jgi:hypothetical protein